MADPGPVSEAEASARLWFWRVWSIIGVGVVLGVLWWLLHEALFILLPPLALAFVIVYALNPLVGWLEGRGVPRPVGTFVAYLVSFGALVGAVAAVGPIVVRQAGEFFDELPAIAADLEDGINAQLSALGLSQQVQLDVSEPSTQEAISRWIEQNRGQITGLLRGAGTVVGRLVHGIVTVILAPVLAFYLLADLPRVSEGLKRLVPPGQRNDVLDVVRRIGTTVGAYFRGQLMVAAFVGVATSIGLALAGLPFWSLVGLLTGLFNLVPLIGPFVGGVIGVLIALTVGGGPSQAVVVVLVMVGVQQIDNHVITPNVVSRTVKVHPVTVMLGLLVAGTLYGILGMLVAIPAIAAAKLVVMYVLVTRVPSMGHLAGEGPNLFDGAPHEKDGSLLELGRELRRAFEKRREDVRRDERRRDRRDEGADLTELAHDTRPDPGAEGRRPEEQQTGPRA